MGIFFFLTMKLKHGRREIYPMLSQQVLPLENRSKVLKYYFGTINALIKIFPLCILSYVVCNTNSSL